MGWNGRHRRRLRHQESEWEGQEVGAEPAHSDQQQAALGAHDRGVVEGKAITWRESIGQPVNLEP